ncbi:glycosyltransferase [candidate division WOR-3 bacterium]|nr:glycosyltransferase [candidate division WOR-3 bacterium]
MCLKKKKRLVIASGYHTNNWAHDISTFIYYSTTYTTRNFKNTYMIAPVPSMPYSPHGILKSSRPPKNTNWEEFQKKNKNIKFYFPHFLYMRGLLKNKIGDIELKTVDKIITEEKLSPDIIHAHFTYPAGYIGAKLKEMYKIPLVITAHGYDIYDLPFRNEFWKNKVKYALETADLIITVSNKNLQCIKKLGIKTPSEIIPNGFDNNLFYPKEIKECRKNLGLSPNKKIILTIGGLVPVKGHKYLIQAMRGVVDKMPNTLCIIIGIGPLKSELKRLINKLNLGNYVKLISGKPHLELPEWINACDVFVLPSLRESFGIVQIEAMACGKPVIVNEELPLSPLIRENKAGILVNIKEIEKIKDVILNSLTDVNLVNEIGKNGKSLVGKNFTWEAVAKELLNVYKRLL